MMSKENRRALSLTVVIFLVLVTATFVPQQGWAQGESAVPFLLIAPNARADGMGEAGGALSDDAAASHWNPAGLAFQLGQEVSVTHSAWLPQFQQSDLFYDYLAYRNHIDDWGGTFAATITYLNLGEFVETGPDPTPLSTFKAYEMAVTAGYSTRAFDDLGVGVNLRYIRSSLAPFNVQDQQRKGIASTVSFDVAMLWKPHSLDVPGVGNLGGRFSVGLNLSNLGPKLTYIDAEQADPLPTNLRLGFAAEVLKTEFNSLNLVLDFNRILVRRRPEIIDSTTNLTIQSASVDNLPKSLFSAWGDRGLKKVTIGGGMEYWYGSPKLIALRFGYFYEAPPPDNGGRKFLTFGAGVRYDIYGFDFSYLSTIEENNPLGETLRFTLLIAWGGQQQQ
ncbi:MAG: type IX secretion system outer membrane channel protein PorV [Ignavibacteriae bacterium]|nr:type IX secretion system outer membrane channel protein PorV [Ignavibacteria bacterium]MBI3364829.1 type IX secretion system outer membrane channel protein PorV [Ignavibacteriota bacterium]